jgi:riboflavin kinase/FMN adenylyltransferase
VPSVVYTFDPPTRVLMQGVEFLSTLPEKLDLLTRYGVDEVVAVPFTPEFAARPKEAFLDDLRTLRPHTVVVGEDFHFGRGRAGGVDDLRAVTPEVVTLPIHQLGGEDIKSTRIREYLKLGDVDGARRLLGRHYDAQGVVVQGDHLGRTIGFPTANISVPDGKALPLGVFAVVVIGDPALPGGSRWHGVANVGVRPTVNGTTRRFEVNVFDFEGDLYGQELQVKFFAHLRGEQKFSGLDELKAQIARDAEAARQALRDVR